MRKQMIAVAIAVVAVLALSGCFRHRTEATIDANGLVSGSIVFGYDREFVKQQPGLGVYNDLRQFTKANAASVSRGTASVEPMDEGQFRGFRITFVEVGPADFVRLMVHEEDNGLDLRLTRQGDEFVFDAQVLSEPGKPPVPPEIFRGAEVMVSLTFPGPVSSSNGTVSGNTVTWNPTLTELPRLTATGKVDQPAEGPAGGRDDGTKPVEAEQSPGGGARAAWIAGSVALMAAAIGTGWVVLRRRSR